MKYPGKLLACLGLLLLVFGNTPFSGLAQAQNRLEQRDEHAQVWKHLVDLLDQMVALMGDEPAPLGGEDLERAIKELPRDKEVVQLYQKLAGADPLPAR